MGREILPDAARIFSIISQFCHLLHCKILRCPLDFPAGVVYSKDNFILNKTLRQTILAGTRKRENRRQVWRGASGFAGGRRKLPLPSAKANLRRGGAPLPALTKQGFEPLFYEWDALPRPIRVEPWSMNFVCFIPFMVKNGMEHFCLPKGAFTK